jgi:hypothetical protein
MNRERERLIGERTQSNSENQSVIAPIGVAIPRLFTPLIAGPGPTMG